MNTKKIAIVGGGNIGSAIAEGLFKNNFYTPEEIVITRKKGQTIEYQFHDRLENHDNNQKALDFADIVIVAVQPKQAKEVYAEIKAYLNPEKHILASIVTGLQLSDIEAMIEMKLPIFRVMPNTAIAIHESMTFISSKNTTETHENLMISILEKLGKVMVIEEVSMLAATVLAACGIAYALRFIRAASQGGTEIGFDAEIAREIAAQTVKGAACLLIERGKHPEQEIDRVTTPQGYTIAGLNEMEHQGFSSALIKGILTSFNKIH